MTRIATKPPRSQVIPDHLRKRPFSESWRPEEDELLEKYANEGLTARQISDKIPGRSRVAVIGRSHRIKVSIWGGTGIARKLAPDKNGVPGFARKAKEEAKAKAKENKALLKAIQALKSKAKAPTLPQVSETDLTNASKDPKRLTELKNSSCKYPTHRCADTGEWLFCGEVRLDDKSPYCQGHHTISYRVVARNR